MDSNRVIEILEDVAMIDRRGAIDAADQIMAQLMAEQRAAIAERARYGDMMTARLVTVEAERDAARALALRMRDERDEYAAAHEQLPCGHPAAFIAAPAGCDPRCELCAVRAERDAFVFELSKSLLESQRRLEQKQDTEAERNALRDEYRLLVERVKAVTPYALNTAAWVTLLATIGIEPEDMYFGK